MIYKTKEELIQALPQKGRILALDIGTKRIGLALCDDDRFIASPKLIIDRKSNLKDFEKIQKFYQENNALAMIIGLPLNMDDSESDMSKFVRNFGKNFDDFLNQKTPILFFDERLSSSSALEFKTKKKKFIDDIAASLILQHFLDEQ